jgi:hypothetical protein
MRQEGRDDIDEYISIGANYTQNEATSMTFTGSQQ